jgi:protein-tyrosine phosphatase
MIDFHNHLMPGVDDGAADVEQSVAALAAFREQGVDTVITTPHVNGSLTRSPQALAARLAELDEGWAALEAAAAESGVRVLRGAEVMLDVPAPDLSDPRLRLAGTRAVLVEFPFMNVPPNAQQAMFELTIAGWMPVLAHPERYGNAARDLADAAEWRRMGAVLQVNGGSLLGRYGKAASELAWGLVEHGLASYLSSDYHARGRCPVTECRAELERRGGELQARLMMEENPRRMLEGAPPLPVPPLQAPRPFWKRILRRA